jgi:hypothetical protein
MYSFLNKIDDEYSIIHREYLRSNKINKNAYFLGHNGIGDNITNSSAIRYLSYFYNNIFFICKDIYEENNKLLFYDLNNVFIITVSECNEFNDCSRIINSLDDNTDIFISGFCHTRYLKSKITNPYLNNYIMDNDTYDNHFQHIQNFYNNINLDLTIYYDFFHIPYTELSNELYNSIKDYNICFMHRKSSENDVIMDDEINNLLYHSNIIFIDINNNYYESSKEINSLKYNLASKFININIIYYLDTIINSKYIYITDSCISCIVYPLYKKNMLHAKEIKILNRYNDKKQTLFMSSN